MGCKQHRACYNNYMNNFLDAADADGNRAFVDPSVADDEDQCRPEAGEGEVSVCRQCCDSGADCGTDLLIKNIFIIPILNERVLYKSS